MIGVCHASEVIQKRPQELLVGLVPRLPAASVQGGEGLQAELSHVARGSLILPPQ